MRSCVNFPLSLCLAAVVATAVALSAQKGGGATPPPNPEIAFVDTSLKVMNADGTNIRTVLSPPRRNDLLRNPSWSPDNTQLAYYGYVGGVEGVWVVNLDGTGARLVAAHGGRLPSMPDWSRRTVADGRTKIAFAAYDITGSGRDVYVVNPDGTGLQNLTNSSSVGEGEAGWTRDGTGLLIRRYTELVLLHLAAAPAPSSGLMVTGETVLLSNWQAAMPRGANAFDLVAFSGTELVGSPAPARGWVLDLSTLPWAPRPLTAATGETSITFSPDDLRLAFWRSGSLGGIFTIGLDGTGERRIASRGRDPSWRRN